MNAALAAAGDVARLFPKFLDPVDMVGCFPAAATLAEVNRAAAAHGLRFPLVADPGRTLAEHMAALEYAPASARFGPYADNVPGMNWRLPSGRRVRIGERVVKSATGYDLLRFLLHSDGRFGAAADYVLRLRPVGGEAFGGRFVGAAETLAAVAGTLRGTSWNHWCDRMDLVVAGVGDGDDAGDGARRAWIEVAGECLAGEREIFLEFLRGVATAAGAGLVADAADAADQSDMADPAKGGRCGLPAFCLKTTPGRVAALAGRCVEALAGTARGLLLNGVVLAYPAGPVVPASFDELRAAVVPAGGHVFGTAVAAAAAGTGAPSRLEAAWATALETEWRGL